MQTATWRFPLAVGFDRTRTSRLVTVTVLGVTAVGAAACLGYVLGLLVTWAASGRSAGSGPSLSYALAAVLAVVAAAGAGLLVAFVARTGAWLEGTFLTVRGLSARTVNLAAASSVRLTGFDADAGEFPVVGGPARCPLLVVVDGGTTVRLRLRSRDGNLLPPAQMRVLADVLAVARCPGAAEAVARLRAMAADPRTLLL